MDGPRRSCATRPSGRRDRSNVAVRAIAIAAFILAALPGFGMAATATWRLTIAPASVEAGTLTTIDVTFSNLGGPSGDDDLGCVKLQIPGAFTVVPPVLVDSPPKTLWLAVGTNTLLIHPSSGGDRLPPEDPSTSVTVSIPVISLTAGTYTWTATAYGSQNCTKAFAEVMNPTVIVHGSATPTPMPTPTPTPTAIATPSPTPTPTPLPTQTPTPTATATPTPTAPGTVTSPPGGSTPAPPPSGDPTLTATPKPPGSQPPDASSAPSAQPTAVPTAGPTQAPPIASGRLDGSSRPSDGAVGGTLLMAGFDGSGGGTAGSGGSPSISLSSAFLNPFGQGFAWAVPGLVLSVPGLLIVLAVIIVQATSAFAWLPVVRRRIGAFDVRRQPVRRGGSDGGRRPR